jgi:hypothetical protein
MIIYFFIGIGLGRTGVLEIVGVWASFPKKLDPEDLFATLILFAMPEYALSADTEGRGAGLAVAVVFEGPEMDAPLLDPAAEDPTAAVPTGLSALTLQVSFTIEQIYGFDPGSFSKATVSEISKYYTISFISSLLQRQQLCFQTYN